MHLTNFRFPALLTALAIALLHFGAQALTPSQAFVNAPLEIFPTLDRTTRLDMMDYFKGGFATESKNSLGGGSAITSMSDTDINIKLTDASSAQLFLLPAGNDTLVAVITTVLTPVPDSKLTIYNRQWQAVTASAFSKPVLRNWLTPQGRKNEKNVSDAVPFLLITYAIDPATMTLTLSNGTRQFLSPDIYDSLEPYLLNSLKYSWNGKRFVLQK